MNALLVSHYEGGDHYKPHPDESIGSMVIWLYKEPKQFTGGEFIFTDYPDVEFLLNQILLLCFLAELGTK